jgi:magnesium chelatase accessory protein
MDWERDGADWPNRAYSRSVHAGGLTWHVQRMGQGPLILLAHGTGASTHSWRAFMPALARNFTVLAVDLPGHAFTTGARGKGLGLRGMATSLGQLLHLLGDKPVLMIGHSAGAAILAQVILDGAARPAALIALNGAMLPIPGFSGHFFSAVAKMLMMLPVVPWFFAWHAGDRATVDRLIAGTGSKLDEPGMAQYARLMADPQHVGNVLDMMANWNLEDLARDLPGLPTKLILVVAEGDKAVPVKVARKIHALVPGSRMIMQPSLGHLSHEEDPEGTAALIRDVAADVGVDVREGQG